MSNEQKLELLTEIVEMWRTGEIDSYAAMARITIITLDNRSVSRKGIEWGLKEVQRLIDTGAI